MPESFTGVPEEEAEVEVLLTDVKGVLLVVVDFEVVLGLLVDVGVLTIVVMTLFKVLVVVLQVGIILLLEHNEVPWRVEVYV